MGYGLTPCALFEFFPEEAVQQRVNEKLRKLPGQTPQANTAAKAEQGGARQKSARDLTRSRHGSRRAGPRRLFTLASNSSPSVSPTGVTSAFGRPQGGIRHQV